MVFPTLYHKESGTEPIDFVGVKDKDHPQCQSIMSGSINRRALLTYILASILLFSLLLNVLGLAIFVGAQPSRSLSEISLFGLLQTYSVAPKD